MGQRGKVEFFFSFFIFFNRSSVMSVHSVVTSSSLTKKKTKKTKKTKKKMIFNLEGLTVYFPYEYLYPVRFKQVDFFYCYSVTIFFLSLFPYPRTIQTTT